MRSDTHAYLYSFPPKLENKKVHALLTRVHLNSLVLKLENGQHASQCLHPAPYASAPRVSIIPGRGNTIQRCSRFAVNTAAKQPPREQERAAREPTRRGILRSSCPSSRDGRGSCTDAERTTPGNRLLPWQAAVAKNRIFLRVESQTSHWMQSGKKQSHGRMTQ